MKLYLYACFALASTQACSQSVVPHYLEARSAGKLPTISYGMGEDRLGGTKMGYIDTSVMFRVIDSTKDLYNVQLSKYHTAYIEKQYLRFDSLPAERPFYLTNSISAKGDTTGDYVSISMDARLPYRSWMEINPSRIVLDIFGVQSNTNWITQLRSLKEVKNVYYNQVEDDVVRVTIELTHRQHWGYSVFYKGRALTVRIKRQPEKLDIRFMKIAIDAGHGGTNIGTGGVHSRYEEKYYTLLFAKALEACLKRHGVKNIVMTRTTDTTFDNKDRVLYMQQNDPDFLISLHLNSSNNPQVNGVSTYYKHIGFRPLTQQILNRMLELKLNEFGNVGNFNFVLNAPTDFPNSLVEIAFMSNEDDEKKVMRSSFQQDVANKIYLGIVDWLKALK